jgi:hypothetical protein
MLSPPESNSDLQGLTMEITSLYGAESPEVVEGCQWKSNQVKKIIIAFVDPLFNPSRLTLYNSHSA